MANTTSATQDVSPLTKPADWALHMVVASLRFSRSSDAPASSYTTRDAGRLDVLNALNWHEAHDEYEWPDFVQLGLDFAQTMRFRRGLVNDVFMALEKAGVIRVTGEPGVLGTPQSSMSKKRAGANDRYCTDTCLAIEVLTERVVGMRMSERKRHCRRESSNTKMASDKEVPYYETDRFLAQSMLSLIEHVGSPVAGRIASLDEGDRLSEEEFANSIQDLVTQIRNAKDDPRPMKRVGNVDVSKSSNEQAPRVSSPEPWTTDDEAKCKHLDATSIPCTR